MNEQNKRLRDIPKRCLSGLLSVAMVASMFADMTLPTFASSDTDDVPAAVTSVNTSDYISSNINKSIAKTVGEMSPAEVESGAYLWNDTEEETETEIPSEVVIEEETSTEPVIETETETETSSDAVIEETVTETFGIDASGNDVPVYYANVVAFEEQIEKVELAEETAEETSVEETSYVSKEDYEDVHLIGDTDDNGLGNTYHYITLHTTLIEKDAVTDGMTINDMYRDCPEAFIADYISTVQVYLSDDGEYYVALIDLGRLSGNGENAIYADFSDGDVSNPTIYNWVIQYDYDTGLMYIPKSFFYDETGTEVFRSLAAQVLVPYEFTDELSSVSVQIQAADDVDLDVESTSVVETSPLDTTITVPFVSAEDADSINTDQIDVYINGSAIASDMRSNLSIDEDGNLVVPVSGINAYSLEVNVVSEQTVTSRNFISADNLICYNGENIGQLLSGHIETKLTGATTVDDMNSIPEAAVKLIGDGLAAGQVYRYTGFSAQSNSGYPYYSTYQAIASAMKNYTYFVGSANDFANIGNGVTNSISTTTKLYQNDAVSEFQLFAALPSGTLKSGNNSVTWKVSDFSTTISNYPDAAKTIGNITSNRVVPAICSGIGTGTDVGSNDLDLNLDYTNLSATSTSVYGTKDTALYAKCLYVNTAKKYSVWSILAPKGGGTQAFAAIYKFSTSPKNDDYYYKLGVDKRDTSGTRIGGATFGVTMDLDNAIEGAKYGGSSYASEHLSPTATGAKYTDVYKSSSSYEYFYIYEEKAPTGYARNRGYWEIILEGVTDKSGLGCKRRVVLYYPEGAGGSNSEITPMTLGTSSQTGKTSAGIDKALAGFYTASTDTTAIVLHAVDEKTTIYYTKIGVTKAQVGKAASSLIAGAKYGVTSDLDTAKSGADSGNISSPYTITTTETASSSVSGNTTYTDVIDMGTTKTRTYYVWEKVAPSGYKRSKGYWEINITGSTNEDGSGSNVNSVKFYTSSQDTEGTDVDRYKSGQAVSSEKGVYSYRLSSDADTYPTSKFPLIRAANETYYFRFGVNKYTVDGYGTKSYSSSANTDAADTISTIGRISGAEFKVGTALNVSGGTSTISGTTWTLSPTSTAGAYIDTVNGSVDTKDFYMKETKAPTGCVINTGLWVIHMQGDTLDAKNSTILWVRYYPSGVPTDTTGLITLKASTSTDNNMTIGTVGDFRKRDGECDYLRVVNKHKYVYSFGSAKYDTDGKAISSGTKVSAYTGWDFAKGVGSGTTVASNVSIGGSFTEVFRGYISESSTATFYIKETAAPTGTVLNDGVWAVSMKGIPYVCSSWGWGSVITSVTYYPSKTSTSNSTTLGNTKITNSLKGYYGTGNSAYYGDKVDGSLHTNRGCLYIINPYYYSVLSFKKYDYDSTSTDVTGATYVLLGNETDAKSYAQYGASGTGTILDTKQSSTSEVSFAVQNQGTTKEKYFYIAETVAATNYERNPGYWKIKVEGVLNPSGTGTKITEITFHYLKDGSWNSQNVGTTVSTGIMRGYYIATNKLRLPDRHYYYYTLGVYKLDNSETFASGAVYTIGTSLSSGTVGGTTYTVSPTEEGDVAYPEGYWKSTSSTLKLYMKETTAAKNHLKNNGLWVITMSGTKKLDSTDGGLGSTITDVKFYPSGTESGKYYTLSDAQYGLGNVISSDCKESAITETQSSYIGIYYKGASNHRPYIVGYNTQYYSVLPVAKYDYNNTSTLLSGASYVLCANDTIAKDFAQNGTKATSTALSTKQTSSSGAVNFAVQEQGRTATAQYFVAEKSATSGYVRNQGYWEVNVTGTQDETGAGTQITSVYYYPYTGNGTWGAKVQLSSTAVARVTKGYYVDGTTDGLRVPDWKYYYAFNLGKFTADGTRLAGAEFTIGDNITNNKTISGTTDTLYPTATGNDTTIVWDSTDSQKTFYMKETTTPKGYVTETGIWKIVANGGTYADGRDCEIVSVTYYPSGNTSGTGYELSETTSLDKTYNSTAKAFLGNWLDSSSTTLDTLELINKQVIYGKISIVKYEQVKEENLSTGTSTTTDNNTVTTTTKKDYGGIKFDIYTSYNSTTKTLSGHPKDADGTTVSSITLSDDGRKTLVVSELSDATHDAGVWYYGTGNKVFYIQENEESASEHGYVADTTIWKVTVTGSTVNTSEATVKWEGVSGKNNGTSATTPSNTTLAAKNYTISGSGDTAVINNYNNYWQIRRTAENNYNKYFKVGNGNVRKYYYAFEVAKSNNSGTKLSGATFKVGDAITSSTTISGNTYTVSPTATANGKAGVWNKTASTATFYMKETQNPTGYLPKDGIWVIEMQGGTKADGSDSKITSVTYYPSGNITKTGYSLTAKSRTESDYTFNTSANEHLGYYYKGTGSTTGTIYYSIVGVVEEQYYAKLGLFKTDDVTGEVVTGATYVLTTDVNVAKNGASGKSFSNGNSKITTGDDTTWFSVQNQTDNETFTYYVYEYSAPTSKLYDRNKGYWKIKVQGVKNPTGVGTQITELTYYKSSTDTTGTTLNAKSDKTGICGYQVDDTTDSFVAPEHPTELFGAVGILKTDSSRSNAAVEGVEYTVYRSFSNAYAKNSGLITLTTNADGYAVETVANIENGAAWYKKDGTTKTFYIRETSVANAKINGKAVFLTRSSDIIEVQITGIEGVDSVKSDSDYTACVVKYRVITSANDTTTAWTTVSAKSTKTTTLSAKTIEASVKYFNRTNIEIPLAGTFGVKKINADDNTAVSGLQFDVYTKSDCSDSAFVQAITTDKNGLAYLDISKIADATVGAGNWYKYDSPTKTFYVRENKASANALGYKWDGTIYKVVITGKDTVDVDGKALSTANAAITVTNASNSKKSYTTASTGKTGYYYFTQYNSPLEVDVTKYDITGSKEVAGAKLTIYKAVKNKDGSFKKNADGSYVQGDILTIDGEEITWISTTEAHVVKKIPTGDYILVEERAPVDYFLAEDIQFSIVDSVLVATVGMKDRDLTKLPTTGSRSDLAVKLSAVLLLSSGVAEIMRRKKKKSRAAMN